MADDFAAKLAARRKAIQDSTVMDPATNVAAPEAVAPVTATPAPVADTGADPFQAKLEAKRAALQAQGAQEQGTQTSGTENAMAAVNEGIAKALALPGATVDALLQQIGVNLFDGGDPESSGLNQFKSMFNAAGINTDPDRTRISAKMGDAGLNTALTTAAIFAAAPSLAARAGVSLKDFVARDFAQFVQKNPGMFIAGEAAAVPGQVLGNEIGGGEGTIGGTLGGIVGGAATGAMGAVATRGLKNVTEPIGAAFARRKVTSPIHPGGQPGDFTTFAQGQIDGDLAIVDKQIENVINRIPAGNPEASSVKVYDNAKRAERVARFREDKFWSRVPKKEIVGTDNLRDQAYGIRNETMTETSPEALPDDIVKRILDETKPETDDAPAEGMTIGRLNALRSDILRKIRTEESAVAPNRPLIRNLTRLSESVMDTMLSGLPDNVPLRQAREFSKQLNDRFTRGPIADILRTRSTGAPFIRPEDSAKKLMTAPGGPQAVANVGTLDGQTTQQLQGAFEDSVKTHFQDVIGLAGPDKAADAANRWIMKNRGLMQTLTKTGAEVQAVADDLFKATAARDAIQKSALAKYAQMEPEAVVGRLTLSKTPRADTKALLNHIGEDGDAHDGLVSAILTDLMKAASNSGTGQLSPQKLGVLMSSSRWSPILSEALTADQMNRLRKNVALAKDIEQGAGKSLVGAASIGARLVGGSIGRLLARGGVGGNIQTPSIIAGVTRGYAEKLFQVTDPSELLRRAIIDPGWERILAVRAPSTTKELKGLAAQMRRANILYQGMFNYNGDDK